MTSPTLAVVKDAIPATDTQNAAYAHQQTQRAPQHHAEEWPGDLAPVALQGLLGEIVRAIEPHSEADQAALLIQSAVAFGALVGPGPHLRIEGNEHPARLNALLVGKTSKARKGTSWGRVKEVFSAVQDWPRVVEGLSSGEGLKYAVRDPVYKLEKNKNGATEQVMVDAGVDDKRLLVVESEFAQVTRQCARPTNTLSPTIRCAWDSGDLQTLTRNDPIVATGAHICVIGHVTVEELRAELTATDSANGFANRFLFMAVQRSKTLPFGGGEMDSSVKTGLLDRIERARDNARERGQVELSPSARDLWIAVYPKLSEGHPGLLGSVTARAEAQTLRLALVYALMDESDVIDQQHLMAALAVWDRCEESARFIFGSAMGDRVADEILRSLRSSPEGLTRTAVNNLFKRNETADRIAAALTLLSARALVKCRKEDGPGRPTEIWEATR